MDKKEEELLEVKVGDCYNVKSPTININLFDQTGNSVINFGKEIFIIILELNFDNSSMEQAIGNKLFHKVLCNGKQIAFIRRSWFSQKYKYATKL